MSASPALHLNVIFLGPADTGKSGTIGRLLYSCASAGEQQRIDQESDQPNRFISMVSRSVHRREGCPTIRPSYWEMVQNSRHYTIIDTPGHPKFTKNLLTGLNGADAMVIMVSASPVEFELQIEPHRAFQSQLLLAYGAGLRRMVVVVTKMDRVQYEQGRYRLITNKVSRIVKKIGYDLSCVTFLPASFLDDENLTNRPVSLSWWNGPTLLQALESIPCPPRLVDYPLRISVRIGHRIKGVGTVAEGMLLTGTLALGQEIRFECGTKAIVHCIEHHRQPKESASAGELVGLHLKLPINRIRRGQVIGDNSSPPALTEGFLAKIVIVNHPGEIKTGYTPMVACHTGYVPCHWTLLQKIDRHSGALLEEDPYFLKEGHAALVKMKPLKPFCVEPFTEFPPFGRIIVRDNGTTVAIGVVETTDQRIVPGSFTKAVGVPIPRNR